MYSYSTRFATTSNLQGPRAILINFTNDFYIANSNSNTRDMGHVGTATVYKRLLLFWLLGTEYAESVLGPSYIPDYLLATH